MRIAITGGNGRIGKAVVELALSEGYDVVNIDRNLGAQDQAGLTCLSIDTTDYAAFEKALEGCDALIHLAAIPAPGIRPDHITHNNNVVSSYNALRAAAQLGINRVCQASSINAVGGAYSRWPRYDYFPLDEQHPTYNDDPYSLSKWICERQADSIVRRYEEISIASLRVHGVVAETAHTRKWQKSYSEIVIKHLWGYTLRAATARAFLLGVTADFCGHETFYIVSPHTMTDEPSLELKAQYYPEVHVQGDLSGNRGFFDCRKAERILGWQHDANGEG